MIENGKIYKTMTPYYDKVKKKMGKKSRPALVIGKADASDYAVLPVSTIKDKNRVDEDYDFEIKKKDFPLLNLDYDSYIRTSKRTTINSNEIISQEIGDLKKSYPDTYLDVMQILKKFTDKLIEEAI